MEVGRLGGGWYSGAVEISDSGGTTGDENMDQRKEWKDMGGVCFMPNESTDSLKESKKGNTHSVSEGPPEKEGVNCINVHFYDFLILSWVIVFNVLCIHCGYSLLNFIKMHPVFYVTDYKQAG